MSLIGLAAGAGRTGNVEGALDLIAGEIDWRNRRRVLVKPNFVSTVRPLACTHVDAVRAVLGFLWDHGVRDVTIAEGPSAEPARIAFERFGYLELAREFGVRFLDLNEDEGVPFEIYDRHLRPITIRLARAIVESDLRISVTPPKTHDTVIVTAGLKNVLMASPLHAGAARAPRWRTSLIAGALAVLPRQLRTFQNVDAILPGVVHHVVPSDKVKVHQGYAVANLNLFLMARLIRPHVAVIDGTAAMEGDGPVEGTAAPLGLALASADVVAADALAAHLMGFDPAGIGYLAYCARAGLGEIDLTRLRITGADPVPLRRRCRASPTHAAQSHWQDARIDEIVERCAVAGVGRVAGVGT